MIFPGGYHQENADGALLESTVRLVSAIHGERAGTLTRNLATLHPMPAQVLSVVHENSGEAVSTLSLIPWKWQLDEVTLDAWEVGIVATHPDHRGQGLSSALMAEAERRIRDAAVPLAIIQGIPYYYRRFGFEHAFNLENHLELELRQVPPPPSGWTWRRAQPGDAGLLWDFDRAPLPYDIRSVRSEAIWTYRLTGAVGTETEVEIELGTDPTGKLGAVVAVTPRGFGDGLIVHEARGGEGAWPAIASRAAEIARRENKPYLRLNLGAKHPFAVWARDRGAQDKGGWHWQVSVPSPLVLLQALATALERRARWGANRPWTLQLDDYRTKTNLAFTPSEGLSFPATVDKPDATLRLPPELWPKLALGWKSVSSLREFYPDCFGWGDRALALVEVLFPPRQGFAESPY